MVNTHNHSRSPAQYLAQQGGKLLKNYGDAMAASAAMYLLLDSGHHGSTAAKDTIDALLALYAVAAPVVLEDTKSAIKYRIMRNLFAATGTLGVYFDKNIDTQGSKLADQVITSVEAGSTIGAVAMDLIKEYQNKHDSPRHIHPQNQTPSAH